MIDEKGKHVSPHTRPGFSIVEMVISTLFLTIIIMGVLGVSRSVATMRTSTRNLVYLTTHNLNCIEHLKQMCQEVDGQLLNYYGDDTFGDTEISTEVHIDTSVWGDFYVYDVRMESKLHDYPQHVVSTYTMTSIGGTPIEEQFNP